MDNMMMRMNNEKNYAELTTEELVKEKKAYKKREIITAAIIGLAIGIFIYGVVNKGRLFMGAIIPLVMIYFIVKNSKKNKQHIEKINAEIEKRSKGDVAPIE